jgi:hypothetical protein
MKKLLFFFILILISIDVSSHIKDVRRRSDGWCEVLLENNQRRSGWIGNKDFDYDFSNTIIVIRRSDGWSQVYNENLSVLSQGWIGNKDFRSFKVNGNKIILRRDDNFMEIYDDKLTRIEQRW